MDTINEMQVSMGFIIIAITPSTNGRGSSRALALGKDAARDKIKKTR